MIPSSKPLRENCSRNPFVYGGATVRLNPTILISHDLSRQMHIALRDYLFPEAEFVQVDDHNGVKQQQA